ncbi:hypothetical protein FRC02_001186 [Tulasnella sp. 418]|nr:hypothetical protein FRC02_001186 [Tulasnella sp. 418]
MMPFAQILYRDGAIYFIIITLCSISNVLVWRYAPVSLSGVAKYFTFSIVNVTASRMVLNLRSQGDATSYQSAQDFDYAYFVDAVSQEPIDMDVVRDLEDQRLAQAQTKQIRLANGVMITTTTTVLSDHPRRTATSPTRSSFSGAKLGDQRRRTSFRRASATVQFEMDVLERSLPRAAAQSNPQNRGKSTSLDVVDETPRGTIEVESSSSHSAATDNTKPRSLE